LLRGEHMRLVCYPTKEEARPTIAAAPVERGWMDRSFRDVTGFAYRCLPLNMANAHGWMILNAAPFTAEWDGTAGLDGVRILSLSESEPLYAASHFGTGVLTFYVHALFRTEPGYDLMVTGPLNMPKDAIQPLTGLVETDWAPFTFTMNWIFTRKNTPVAFERDEPFCMIYPVTRGLLEAVEPEIRPMTSDPEVYEGYTAYAESRQAFKRDLLVPGSEAQRQEWQKHYFRGQTHSGATAPDHRTKLTLKEFKPVR